MEVILFDLSEKLEVGLKGRLAGVKKQESKSVAAYGGSVTDLKVRFILQNRNLPRIQYGFPRHT